jgi:hypothetical protein
VPRVCFSRTLPPLVTSRYVTPDRLEWPQVHFPPVHCGDGAWTVNRREGTCDVRAGSRFGRGFQNTQGDRECRLGSTVRGFWER